MVLPQASDMLATARKIRCVFSVQHDLSDFETKLVERSMVLNLVPYKTPDRKPEDPDVDVAGSSLLSPTSDL